MEFTQSLRHHCRDPKCRMKLKEPVENTHKAFCTPGCYSSFYLKRCLVCENNKPSGQKKFCRRPKCRTEYHANPGLFELKAQKPAHASSEHRLGSRNADETGIKSGLVDDRPHRIVAGPVITANVYHCATVPDGPDCQWAGGEWRRIGGRNRAALKARPKSRKELARVQFYSDWRPCLPSDRATLPDLSIPDFLKRTDGRKRAA
jgi:hypothetical protein